MDFSKVYCKSERFVEKSIGNEKVLVPLTDNVADMNHVLTLNEVGAFLYDHIDGERSIEDILMMLLSEYEVARDVAQNDVEQFFANTVSKEIIYEKQ